MEYLVRFAQLHETFRKPEIEALAIVAGIDLEIIEYDEKVSWRFGFTACRCMTLLRSGC